MHEVELPPHLGKFVDELEPLLVKRRVIRFFAPCRGARQTVYCWLQGPKANNVGVTGESLILD